MREADVLEGEGGVGGWELHRESASRCWRRSRYREAIPYDVKGVWIRKSIEPKQDK